MNAASNKQAMQAIFAELAEGNGRPFVAALSDDMKWHMTGTNAWSGSYIGKREVIDRLLTPLFAQFETRYKNRAVRLVAEDDMVVVECRGEVVTRQGKPYNNTYCYVCRMRDGMICELTEYMDTELVREALAPPA